MADGAGQGTLGHAMKDDRGQLKLLEFNESMIEVQVDIADDVFFVES